MLRRIKDHLVPHEGNDHIPKILHRNIVEYVLLGILVIEIIFLVSALFILPGNSFLASLTPEALARAANQERQNRAVPVLQFNVQLAEAAGMKAQDMANRGYFAHQTPEGEEPWVWLDRAGYSFAYAGENLAVNFIDAQDVNRAWMDSPTHRNNILNSSYREIGIGTAVGEYKGREAVFVVQFFGTPRTVTPTQSVASAPKTLPSGSQEKAVAVAKKSLPVAQEHINPEEQEEQKEQKEQGEDPLFLAQEVSGQETSYEFARGPIGMYALSSPRVNTGMLFLLVSLVLGLVLLVKMLARFHVVHDRPIVLRGLAVIGLAVLLRVVNEFISLSGITIF